MLHAWFLSSWAEQRQQYLLSSTRYKTRYLIFFLVLFGLRTFRKLIVQRSFHNLRFYRRSASLTGNPWRSVLETPPVQRTPSPYFPLWRGLSPMECGVCLSVSDGRLFWNRRRYESGPNEASRAACARAVEGREVGGRAAGRQSGLSPTAAMRSKPLGAWRK